MHRRIVSYRIRPSCMSPHQPLYASDGREDGTSGKKVTVADVARYSVSAHSGCLKRLSGALTGGRSPPSRCRNVRAHRLTLCSQSSSCARATRPRIGHELGRQLKEGLTDLGRIAHADIGDVWPVGEESLYGSLAFGRQRLKSFCQDSGIQRRSHFAFSHGSHSLSRSSCAAAIYLPASRYGCQCRHRHVTRSSADGGHSSCRALLQESD